MRELEVSVDFISATASLRDLQQLVAIAPSDGSHDKNDIHPDGHLWGTTRMRITAPLSGTDSLSNQLNSLRAIFAENECDLSRLPDDAAIELDVAVFHDRPMVSLSVPLTSILGFGFRIDSVVVSAYTCQEAERLEVTEKRAAAPPRRQRQR